MDPDRDVNSDVDAAEELVSNEPEPMDIRPEQSASSAEPAAKRAV